MLLATAQTAALKWVAASSAGVSNPLGLPNSSFRNLIVPVSSATDAAGNTYVTGNVVGTVSMQTTTPPATLGAVSSIGGSYSQSNVSPYTVSTNAFVAKYDASGVLSWSHVFVTTTSPQAYVNASDIKIDASGNVIVAFNFGGSFDINPEAGSSVLTSGSVNNLNGFSYLNSMAVLKLSSAGAYVGHFARIGAGNVNASRTYTAGRLGTDSQGNIIVSGRTEEGGENPGSVGDGNLDPANSIQGSIGITTNFIAKYNSNFGFIDYNNLYGDGSLLLYNITVDAAGDIYAVGNVRQVGSVAGAYFNGNGSNSFPAVLTGTADPDMFIAKYSGADMNIVYANVFGNNGGGDDAALSVKVEQGVVYMTGYYRGTIDFDPSNAVASRTAGGDADMFIAKYNAANGNYVSAISIGGPLTDVSYDLAVSTAQNKVYITGQYLDSIDCNPSAGVNKIYSLGRYDGFIAAYDLGLNYENAYSVGSTYAQNFSERGYSLTTSDSTVKLLGDVRGTTDYDFTSANVSVNPGAALYGLYLAKYRFYTPCNIGPISFTGNTVLCSGTTAITATAATATSYTWSNSLGNNATANISAIGTYTVTASAFTGCSVTASLSITNNSTISQQPVSLSVCAGSAAMFSVAVSGTGNTYVWKKGNTAIPNSNNDTLLIPNVQSADTGSYTCQITSGCNGAVLTSNVATLTFVSTPVVSGTGLVLHLPFYGNFANVSPVPLTVNSVNSPALTNDATNTPFNAALYNGLSHNTVTHNAALTFSTSFTASFWVYLNNLSDIRFIDKSNGNTQSYFIDLAAGKVRFCIAGGTMVSTTTLQTSQWYHIACVYNGSDIAIYINGVLNGSVPNTATPVPNTNNLYIGAAMNFFGNTSLNGRMDEIRLYNRPLSAQEVAILGNVPVIVSNPQPVSTCAGQTSQLSITADSKATRFEWFKDNVLIPNSNNDTLIIPNTSTANAGNYHCVAYNSSCNGIESAKAALTVTPNSTAITLQPQNVDVCVGQSAVFTIAASGNVTGYQWQRNGTNITNATSTTYTTVATLADSGAVITCIVSGGNCGAITSTSAVLKVNAAPVAAITPATATVCSGNATTLTASGNGTYSWSNNLGTTAAVAAAPTANTTYTVTVTAGTCTATASAVVTVNAATSISIQPTVQSACLGGAVSFSVSATGTNLTYQWRKGANNINNATAATYSIASAALTDTGSYSVVITGTCGTVTSQTVVLTVTASLQVTQQPSTVVACQGSSAILTVGATGSNLTYQWFKGATSLSNTNNDTLYLNNLTLANAGSYTCNITSACGTGTSNAATVTVNAASSTVLTQSICAGTTYTFAGNTLSSAGTYYDTLQNVAGCDSVVTLNLSVVNPINTPISASICNNSSYDFNGTTLTTAGVYTDTLSSVHGCDSIITLTLSLASLPNITVQPVASATATCQGTIVTLSATATGGNLSYQWFENGSSLQGANSDTYTTTPLSAGNKVYTLEVSNACATQLSDSATVTVYANPAPTITQTGFELSTQQYATYQWKLDGSDISGATLQQHTATANGDYEVYVTDVNGCSGSSAVLNVTGTSIDEANLTTIGIYPNPVVDVLSITSNQHIASVSVYTASGQLVQLNQYMVDANKYMIDTAPIAEGLYVVYINTVDGNTSTVKFVKQ